MVQTETEDWIERGDQLFAGIQRHRGKENLGWALMAAVAIAIARHSGSDIEDATGHFTPACDGIGPEEFVRALAAENDAKDIDAAADAFASRLHRSPDLARFLDGLGTS